MTVALEVERLNRTFGALPVARDINLSLEHGARHALIGPNGAGKTTLVNLITGVVKPHSGRVILNGEDITALSQADRARRGLARTFHQPAVPRAHGAGKHRHVHQRTRRPCP